MQNQDANLRPKTSESFNDTAGVYFFKISSGQRWFSSDNLAHIVEIKSKCLEGIGAPAPEILAVLKMFRDNIHIPWVAAQAVRWSAIPKVARSDLTPSPHCSVQ